MDTLPSRPAALTRLVIGFLCASAVAGCATGAPELPDARVARASNGEARAPSGDMLAEHLRFVQAYLSVPLSRGNQAHLLVDGPQTHETMFAAIQAAHDHINFETYILSDDDVGERLAQALVAKQSQGITVNIIYDSIGAINVPRQYFARLRDAGIALCEFNPVNPLRAKLPWRLNHRDHRKLLVVDGKLGFTGGIHLTRNYASSAVGSGNKDPARGWRDTHVAIEGPVVAHLQREFIETWHKQRCGPLRAAHYTPALPEKGTQIARVIAQDPLTRSNDVYTALLSAISHAKRRVYLTYGYFVPDARTLNTLGDSARRGVDVRLLLPGFSDFWAPFRAGRSRYGELFAVGVRIYEYRDVFLHAKTAVIDGVWSTVGSANLDWRSLVHNEELNVVILGEAFSSELEALFARDISEAHEVTWEEWNRRPSDEKLKEWIARRFEYWL